MVLNTYNVKEELLVFLRNQDIISTTNRGVTTVTGTFSGDGSATVFTLLNHPVKNVRTVTVGGSSQSFGHDYSVSYGSESSLETVFSDNFNRSDSGTVGNNWTQGGSGGVSIVSNTLQIYDNSASSPAPFAKQDNQWSTSKNYVKLYTRMKISSIASKYAIVNLTDNGSNTESKIEMDSNKIKLALNIDSGGWSYTDLVSLAANTWYNIEAIYNLVDNTVKVYINGTLEATESISTSTTSFNYLECAGAIVDNGFYVWYDDIAVVEADSDSFGTTITFGTAPAAGDANIVVSYDYTSDTAKTERVYPDFPRTDLTLKHYPRLGIDIIASPSREVGANADLVLTDMFIRTIAYATKTKDVDDMINDIRSDIINNKKNFYNFNLISPVSMGPVDPEPNRHKKVVSRSCDFKIYVESE